MRLPATGTWVRESKDTAARAATVGQAKEGACGDSSAPGSGGGGGRGRGGRAVEVKTFIEKPSSSEVEELARAMSGTALPDDKLLTVFGLYVINDTHVSFPTPITLPPLLLPLLPLPPLPLPPLPHPPTSCALCCAPAAGREHLLSTCKHRMHLTRRARPCCHACILLFS